MLKKIPVSQLCLGMHLHALEGPWLSHPFWKTKFVIRSEADLAKLHDSGVAECWIDTALGLDVPAAPAEARAPAPPPRAAPAATGMAEDLQQATRLLNDAGWTKGGDGTYRNGAGQQIAFDITASNQPKNVQEASAVAAQYTAFGIPSNPTPYPAAAQNAVEIRHTYKGFLIWPASSFSNALDGFQSGQIGTEQNRYRGNNYGGWRSADYDRIYEQYGITLETQKSQELVAQMMKLVEDDVGAIPLYYVALGVAFRKGIVGPSGAAPDQAANAWNLHTWDVIS